MSICSKYEINSNRLGFSTACFYPQLTENAFLNVCKNLNSKTCELFVNTISETKNETKKLILQIKNDYNIKIPSIHPCFSGYEYMMFFSKYKRRLLDSIDMYKYFFEFAQSLQSKFVVFHGCTTVIPIECEEYYEIFAEINSVARKFDVTLCHENVVGNYTCALKFIDEFINVAKKYNDKINFVFDIKHSILAGINPIDMIRTMGENIAHVHLNDYDFSNKKEKSLSRANCKLPFFGGVNYKPIIKELFHNNYIGDFIIEVYRNNYKDEKEMITSSEKFLNFSKNIIN